jgi:TatD DNase family protein
MLLMVCCCHGVSLLQMVQALPLDCLLLETDAPALGPDKDAPNVPANIVISAQAVAKIKGLPLDHVVQVTTENALKLFTRLKLCQ